MRSFWIILVQGGVVAGWMLTIGLRGIVTKRPVIFPVRRMFWLLVIAFSPITLLPFSTALEMRNLTLRDFGLPLFMLLFFVVMLVFFWKMLRGYSIMGVDADAFREALQRALRKLNLPFEESLTKLRLPTLDAELEANVNSWMGGANLSIKQPQHAAILKQVIEALREELRASPAPTQQTMFGFFLIFGALLIVMLAVVGIYSWHVSALLDELSRPAR